MQVVFLKTIPQVAAAGDVKTVSAGYARNFLFPGKLARPATAEARQVAERHLQRRQAAVAKQAAALAELQQSIGKLHPRLSAAANEQGTLFAAVTGPMILDAMRPQMGSAVDELTITAAIKTVGDHEVSVRFSNGQTVPLTITVEAKA